MDENTTFAERERLRAAAWAARRGFEPAPWIDHTGRERGRPLPWCLPRDHAAHNLLRGVRGPAVALFHELGIPWHCGVDGGPGNNLLSSQVQCVNALMPAVGDASVPARVFASAIDVGEVVEIEAGRFLTFEYIGPTDYFGESPGRPRVRGARCTSVDAAFQHIAPDGVLELVLVEWKYTESYATAPLRDPVRDAIRRRRYEVDLLDPDGPINSSVVSVDDLLVEPVYQLVRQQLLAWRLERDPAVPAQRVRVLHARPAENFAYQASVPEHLAHLGSTVDEVWGRLLQADDRFTSMDSAALDTSTGYANRYAWGPAPGEDDQPSR